MDLEFGPYIIMLGKGGDGEAEVAGKNPWQDSTTVEGRIPKVKLLTEGHVPRMSFIPTGLKNHPLGTLASQCQLPAPQESPIPISEG